MDQSHVYPCFSCVNIFFLFCIILFLNGKDKNKILNWFHISMAKVQNCLSLFATFQTSRHTWFFFFRKLVNIIPWKLPWFFLICQRNIPREYQAINLAYFSAKKWSKRGNFRTLEWWFVVLHFGCRCGKYLFTSNIVCSFIAD